MTPATPRRWGAWHLLAAWMVYWAVLAVVTLGRPAVLVWRLAHGPEGHGGASINLTNDVLTLSVAENGATAWAASLRLLTLALWIAGPPLVLFVLWLRSRPALAGGEGALTEGEHARALAESAGPVLDPAAPRAPASDRVPR